MSSGIGAIIRDMKPIMIDIQMDSSRSIVSRTRVNVNMTNKQVERSIRRFRNIYAHLAKNVNTFA